MTQTALDPAFIAALEQSWCYETCWDGCKPDYDGTNPALGQCFVSTLIAWAIRGYQDEIVPSLVYEPQAPTHKPAWHFYLEQTGPAAQKTAIDLTRRQFAAGSRIEECREGHPDHNRMVYHSVFEAREGASLAHRLGVLLSRLRENGFDAGLHPPDILSRLAKIFSYAKALPAPPPAGPSL
ncbi:MAG: hypothetical protein H6867_01710 [Rhodospirillales bacterium]|nr:hypothetical protein [Rhodospirillales bacterium]MCB9997234.1 hypothetical protein [Rhodospirillales bacterium]